MRRPVGRALCVLALAAGTALAADDPAARRIVVDSDHRTSSHTERIRYQMELIDADGKVIQTRVIDAYSRKQGKEEITVHKFLAPPVVEGTGMMIVDTGQSENDIWFYSPATRRLRRVAGAEKTNWYMGTEFTYEDFEDYQEESYAFTLEGEAACLDPQGCYVIAATPATSAERRASGYTGKRYWIGKRSLYPVRVDYLGQDGTAVKRLTAEGLQPIQQYWRPKRLVMLNLLNHRQTRVTTLQREIDRPIKEYYLSKRFVRSE